MATVHTSPESVHLAEARRPAIAGLLAVALVLVALAALGVVVHLTLGGTAVAAFVVAVALAAPTTLNALFAYSVAPKTEHVHPHGMRFASRSDHGNAQDPQNS